MKIKLMICSLVTVLSLQGSQYKDGSLYDAIILSLQNRKDNKFNPIILHKIYSFKNIQKQMRGSDINNIMDDIEEDSPTIMVLSDPEDSPKREILKLELGKKISNEQYKDTVLLKHTRSYEKNKITQIDEFKDHEGAINCLKGRFVIFNMQHPGVVAKTSCYTNEINDLLNDDCTSILAIVGPKYNGVSIEDLCINNGVKPIVFNKPKHPIIIFFNNHCKKLIGLSLAALLGLIYYCKFAR